MFKFSWSLIITTVFVMLFPTVYFYGWLLTLLPSYYVLFKAATLKIKDPYYSFKKNSQESYKNFFIRRIFVIFLWSSVIVLTWWIFLLIVVGNKSEVLIDALAEELDND